MARIYPSQYASNYYEGTTETLGRITGDSYGKRVLIEWVSYEPADFTFEVSLQEIPQGRDASKPLQATLGANRPAGTGRWYYTYTPTKNCLLKVTGAMDVVLRFPFSLNDAESNRNDVFVDGLSTIFEVTEGIAYPIVVNNNSSSVFANFTIEEVDPAEGQSKDLAIDVTETGSYTLDETPVGPLWIKYTAKSSGMVQIDYDLPVEGSTETITYLVTTILLRPMSMAG